MSKCPKNASAPSKPSRTSPFLRGKGGGGASSLWTAVVASTCCRSTHHCRRGKLSACARPLALRKHHDSEHRRGAHGSTIRGFLTSFSNQPNSTCFVVCRATWAIESTNGISFGQTSTQFCALPQPAAPVGAHDRFETFGAMKLSARMQIEKAYLVERRGSTKSDAPFTCGHASRQHPHVMQRDSGTPLLDSPATAEVPDRVRASRRNRSML